MKIERFRNQFVEFIPETLEEGVLYVSMRYRTVSHLCPCGCRQEVPLSISPTAWELTFNGEITLNPSVGNWSFSCRSHYFIRGGYVCWAGKMSEKAIEFGRANVVSRKKEFYGDENIVERAANIPTESSVVMPTRKEGGLKAWLKKLFQ